MTRRGQIPSYGQHFRRVSVAYEPDRDLASTIYVLKPNGLWHIRSNKSSKGWWVFAIGRSVGGPFPNMRSAMAACVTATDALAAS